MANDLSRGRYGLRYSERGKTAKSACGDKSPITQPLFKYRVSYTLDVEDESPEAAAIQVDRLLTTTRPKEFDITPTGGKTVFVRVERGEAKRIA